MSLATKFNATYSFKSLNDNILRVIVKESGYSNPTVTYIYDFSAGIMHTRLYSDSFFTSVPFSQLDRASLEVYRTKLCQEGGHPPPLPPQEPQDNVVKLATVKNSLPMP